MTVIRNMACPKCGGWMRSFERSRLIVEQCEECRGFFLDYGELERLIDAEGGGWSGRVGPPAAVAATPPPVSANLPARRASDSPAKPVAPQASRRSDPPGLHERVRTAR